MTSFNTEFTKESFLDLPEFTEKKDAPNDKTSFLFGPRQVQQKEALLEVLENMSKANAEMLSASAGTKEVIKVMYTVRHTDGNISDRGGFIRLDLVIADLLRVASVKVGETDSNGVLTIETA